jgi:transcriptional/translational regulatory protein YebC/TACO1
MDEEEVLETLLMEDLDVEDISEEDGIVEVEADGYEVAKIQAALEEAGAEIVDTERGWYPIESIKIDEATQIQFDKFMALINDVEDVQDVYHNVDSEEE